MSGGKGGAAGEKEVDWFKLYANKNYQFRDD